MAQVRILVLTSSTGAGHDARAESFAEWCFQLYRHEVDVRIEQMLEKSSRVARAGVNFYNWIQRRSPWLHTAYYTFVEGLSYLNRSSVSLGRGYYIRVLREYRPHLVFSVHDCLNRGYFPLARKVLGAAKVRCATYCGEFSGGWGYSRNWIEPSVDLYISRTPTANDYAVKKGIPAERTRVRGYLMRPHAQLERLAPGARTHARATEFGLRPDLFTVLLATGGNGANNHLALLPVLARHADRCQAVLVCGRSRETFNELVHWRTQHPEFHCHIEGHTEIMHLLLQVSDVVVTRGGTTTCTEALAFGCPIIFNAMGGIMPQERLTWKFFRNGADARKIDTVPDFDEIITGWLDLPEAYAHERRKFLQLRYAEDPTLVIDDLVTLANEVAGVDLHRQAFPPAGVARLRFVTDRPEQPADDVSGDV